MTVVLAEHTWVITSAGALMGQASAILSDFEVETIATVSKRWLDQPNDAVSTDAEFAVVEGAVAAMRAYVRRPIVRSAA